MDQSEDFNKALPVQCLTDLLSDNYANLISNNLPINRTLETSHGVRSGSIMNILKPPEAVNLTTGNVAENCSGWEQQFLTYFTACELSEKPKPTQVAVLLHTAGPDAQKIQRHSPMKRMPTKKTT